MNLRASLLVASVVISAACSPRQTMIDGYPVGEPAACPDGCPREISTAVHWLDRTSPGHPAPTRVVMHLPDYRTADGSRLLATRSGGSTYVAVFTFEDAPPRAVQVGCGIGPDPWPCFTTPPGAAAPITIETP